LAPEGGFRIVFRKLKIWGVEEEIRKLKKKELFRGSPLSTQGEQESWKGRGHTSNGGLEGTNQEGRATSLPAPRLCPCRGAHLPKGAIDPPDADAICGVSLRRGEIGKIKIQW